MINLSIDNLRQKYEFKYKGFVLPAVVFLIIIGLSVTFGKSLLFELLNQRSSIDQTRSKIKNLQANKAILQSLDEAQLQDQVQVTLRAVPGVSSTLPTLSSLKNLASTVGVTITNFNVAESPSKQTGDNGGAVRKISFSFTLDGDLAKIITFLERMHSTAPLTKINQVDLSATSRRSKINFVSFWSPLSETLPPADEPVYALNQSEMKAIENLRKLQGDIIQSKNLPTPEGRSNPFEAPQ